MNPWARATVQGAACGLMFGLVVLIGGRVWQPSSAVFEQVKTRYVTTRSLVLVNAAGQVRASLSMFPDLAVDETGSQEIPQLILSDAAGKTRLLLGVLPGGDPFLSLWDAAGNEIWRSPRR